MKGPISRLKMMRMHKMLMTDNHCARHIKQPMHMNKKSNRKVNHTGKM